jgi:hypothetical protein
MKRRTMVKQLKFPRMVMAAALTVAGVVIGANMSPNNVAHGEVRGTPEPPTFQAGSVPILRDISATLRQIDSRLARLEVVAQKLQTAAARNAVPVAEVPATDAIEESN